MDISFKKVTIDEVPQLAALAKEIWVQHFTPIIGSAQVAYMLEKFQSEKPMTEQMNGVYSYYWFMKNGAPVGYICFKPENGKMFLSKLYLRQNERGNGYATKAIEFLSDYCKEQKLSSIWLTVNRHNDNTVAVYKHLGFVTTREQAADIGNGFVMDDYIMEKTVL